MAETDATERPHVVSVVYDFHGRALHTCLECHFAGFSAPPLPCPGRALREAAAPVLLLDVRPRWPRRLWLGRHVRRHPQHILIGWNGHPLQCGTCLGVPEPQLSRGAFSRWYRPRVEHIWLTKVTRVNPTPEATP